MYRLKIKTLFLPTVNYDSKKEIASEKKCWDPIKEVPAELYLLIINDDNP